MRLLSFALIALLSSCSCGEPVVGPEGPQGPKGDQGEQGPPGLDGVNGVDGINGIDGIDGVDVNTGNGETQIIALTGIDENGTDNDTDVVVDFAGDIDLVDLAAETITLSFSQRSAPELVSGPGCLDGECFAVVDGRRILDLDGDAATDGFLDPGSLFHLRFDRVMQVTTRDDLAAWINGVIGIDEAFDVVENGTGDEFQFSYRLDVPLPVTSFDANGENVGLSLILPPFTVRDQTGDGNALTELILTDGAALADQAEPTGLPFDPVVDVETTIREDGIFGTNDLFLLRFDRLMDPQSTEQAIEFRLEEAGVFVNVTVFSFGDDFFIVQNNGAPVNVGAQGHELVLEPHDVTSAAGITNSTQQIRFVITDITVPTLLANAGNGDTLAVFLETGVPARLSNGVQDNNLLVAGDTLLWEFSEPMDGASTQADIARQLNLLGVAAAANEVVAVGGNTGFVYTLQAGEQAAVGALLTLDPHDTAAVTDLDLADDVGIAIAANQVPRATRDVFIVQAVLETQGSGTDTLGVLLGATPREDNIIEAGDILFAELTKFMDPVTTADEFADQIVSGALSGGVRRGVFDVATVRSSIVVAGNLVAYQLQGNQQFEIQAAELSFEALATTVLDDNGLSLADNQVLRISDAAFDPDAAPTLAAVVGARVATTDCGDGLLVAGDTITFTFSEPLVDDAPAIASIIGALNAVANGTDVDAGDFAVFGNQTFVVQLPQGASLATNAAIAFNLATAGIEDLNGVAAQTLSATMEPVDVLAATVALVRNLVENDGRLVGGDALAVTWSCQMDEFETLSSIQEAVDALMGDGTAQTRTANNVTYVVSVLPGQAFALPAQATLTVNDVATDVDIAGEGNDADDDGLVRIAGPFALTFDDLPIEDVTLRFVAGSNNGTQAIFRAAAPLETGTWFLSTTSTGLTRVSTELPVVFTDFE